MQVEADTSHPGSTWTHCPSMQGWDQEDQFSDRDETGEECERQQGLTGTAPAKGRQKKVSSLLNRNGEEMTKGTEKHEVLIAFFALAITGKISSQVSCTPEVRLWGKEILPMSEEDQVRDKLHIQAEQYTHPRFTKADQSHSSLEGTWQVK